tara:strand:- start:282 stop:707 length:426 start_codon:yes stop_codon:yes gene_type:complete
MKNIIILLFITFTSFSQNDDSYEKALKKFMDTQGTWELLDIQMDLIFKQFNIDVILNEEEVKEVRKDMYKDLIKIYTPIYKNHFNIKELEEMTSFFESGIGKKFVEKSPIMMQEVLPETTKWGLELGVKLQGLIQNKRNNN